MVSTYEYIIKKYNIDIGRRYIVDIPDMDRESLAELFEELRFDLGVEVGVNKGSYSELLCHKNPRLHLYSVDPWDVSAYHPDTHGVETEQHKYDVIYEEAKAKLAPYNCEIMRKDSLSASKYFPDESIDFVYIDGNHDFVNVTNDIDVWSKKVRSGGIIAGHDYAYFPLKKRNHVKYVVQSYTRAHGIIPHFVVGAESTDDPDMKRDAVRSWFWVKQ